MRQQRSQRKAYLFFLVLLALVLDSRSIYFSKASSFGTAQFLPFVQNEEPSNLEVIYSSRNLEGHEIFAECNPGGGTNCACSGEDVRITAYGDFGEVISNVREVNTYVNAIGFKKFTEKFDLGIPVGLGVYQYIGEFRITRVPAQDTSQLENGQAIHLMVQFWDGRNAHYQADSFSLEGALYWDLNPWEVDYGKIMVYTYPPLKLVETGIYLEPDTNWHSFELVVDLAGQRYRSIRINGQEKALQHVGLAKVFHPDWGNDVSLSITTESLATWPQYDCTNIFKWTSRFKNLEFSMLR
jgi:hypothetical protein